MTRTRRLFAIGGWTLWFLLLLAVSAHWISRAQTTEPAQDDPRFTGVSTGLEATGLNVSRRRFEPGARSAWHFHDHGQLLFVEEGRARTQKRGQALKEMGPGESDYTAPRIEHWHGAAPHEHFIQVAVGFGSGITLAREDDRRAVQRDREVARSTAPRSGRGLRYSSPATSW